jgi:Tfp pilus assembly protein PilV
MVMQSQSKKLQAQSGFLLIELLVALLLLAVFTYIIAYYQSMSIQTGYEAIQRWKAVNVVSSFLAKATVDQALLQKKTYEEDGYVVTWEKMPMKISLPSCFTTFKKNSYLNVTVTWSGYYNKQYSYQCIGGVSS